MRQSSSNEGPFVIADGSKPAPETGTKSRSSSTTALPSSLSPKQVASIEGNSEPFKHGFEEQLVEGRIAKNLLFPNAMACLLGQARVRAAGISL